MSPEFQKFQLYLGAISEKEETPTEIIFREDVRKSNKDCAVYVLYIWYEDDKWEYHWFYFPKREAILAELEFAEFENCM